MTEVNENGSEMKVECSTCIQLLKRRSTCRHWSKRKELDTFRHDRYSTVRPLNWNSVISWGKRHHVTLHTIKHGQPLVITPGLVSSDSHLKSFIIAVTLVVFSYLWHANRAACHWTCSSLWQFCTVWEAQAVVAYSIIGRTRVV